VRETSVRRTNRRANRPCAKPIRHGAAGCALEKGSETEHASRLLADLDDRGQCLDIQTISPAGRIAQEHPV
jgi:hypothetical protein